MELKKKKCQPHSNEKAPPLEIKDEEELIGNLVNWDISRHKEHKLVKTVRAETFMDAVAVLNEIALLAQKEEHHPDLHLHYNRLTIEMYTHTICGLSENDFIMAAKIDEILEGRHLL